MSEDWSQPLGNTAHERFAQLVAGGLDAKDAYRRIYPKTTPEGAKASGSRLLSKVIRRVEWFQAQSATETVMDMRERRIFFARNKRVFLHKIDLEKDGDLVQEIDYHDKEEGGGIKKIKTMGKRECVMDDAKLAGELVEKAEVTIRQPLTPEQISEAMRRSPALATIGRS